MSEKFALVLKDTTCKTCYIGIFWMNLKSLNFFSFCDSNKKWKYATLVIGKKTKYIEFELKTSHFCI